MESSIDPVENEGRLARIETKLDLHLATTSAHDSRLKWLETKVNFFMGIMAVVNVFFMLYATRILKVLNG